MAIAGRIARARTHRDTVAFCGYHGWNDWYLAANLAETSALDGHLLPGLLPAGGPRGLAGTSVPFRYNHVDELEAIAARKGEDLAAIIMEPVRNDDPNPEFLDRVREIAEECGALLIVDEVSSGFRLSTGGAYPLYGIRPDIAVFAKAMSNGYPMAAIVGREDTMQAAQDTFISSTYWTERIGPVAAIATITKYLRHDVPSHLIRTGRAVQSGWADAAGEADLAVEIGGIPPLSHVAFTGPAAPMIQTLFTQMMLERGFLAGKSFYASYAHSEQHVEAYIDAARETFSTIAGALEKGDAEKLLNGPVAHAGFARLT